MRTLSAFLLLFGLTAWANPIVFEPSRGIYSYIDSEKLTVSLSPAGATFTATFTFAANAEDALFFQTKATPVTVQLPIWFPEESGGDSIVESFWRVFRQGECNDLATNAVARRVFDTAVGLKILIGERQLDLACDIGRFGALRSLDGISEPGFSCLWVNFSAGAEFVWKRTPVTISYRQPLLRAGGESCFFYLPIFENLSREISTADTERYAITIVAAGCTLKIDTAGKEITIEDGKSLTLAPKARQAIRARLVLGPGQAASGNGATASLVRVMSR